MKSRIILFAVFSAVAFVVSAQRSKIPVFVSGTDGFASFRIPAIIRTPDNRLLAFCEGRVNGSADFGNIKIVMKRSSDEGKTWTTLQVVASNDTLQAGNPAPVMDLTDPAYPKGRIFLFYCTGNRTEGTIRKGQGVREVWYKTSTDDGANWSKPVNITVQTHRPHQPAVNPAYNFSEDWRCYATTPGHAIQLVGGAYAGRILVPMNYSRGDPQAHFGDFAAADFYTDDHGRSFHLGQDV
ncbi:MAG TPA: sialidase family protein, partial [Puia sp.]|nr:sialidase family protein [Puia sp.]